MNNIRASQLPLLELTNVTVERDGNRILDNVSLAIPQHRHTAIIGPNGAGKTSLLRILDRQYYPSVADDGQQGTVKILGESRWEVADLRKQMGIVSSSLDHNFALGRTGRMTVLEAVASGFTATELAEFGLPIDDQIRAQVTTALLQVSADHLIQRQVATLSTGERRRVLIARALVHQPKILILDEPTTGLDLAAQFHFLEILAQLCRQPSLTVVLVTHHLEEVIDEFQQVLLLSGGRIEFDGPTNQALTAEKIGPLYGLPITLERRVRGWSASVQSANS